MCPKCMVQCAVGQRCPKCASKFQSHAVKTTPFLLARTAVAAFVVGYGFGLMESSIGSGMYLWIVLYFCGVLVGRGLHWVARYKLGTQIVTTVSVALLSGMLLSPLHNWIFNMVLTAFATKGAEGAGIDMLSYVLWRAFAMGLFVYGALCPFLRRA